jgi:hypothetical protein
MNLRQPITNKIKEPLGITSNLQIYITNKNNTRKIKKFIKTTESYHPLRKENKQKPTSSLKKDHHLMPLLKSIKRFLAKALNDINSCYALHSLQTSARVAVI